jgi:uncharacterized protein
MSNEIGKISWADLTSEAAEDVGAFYREVVGWKSEGVEMGGYQDHCMLSEDGTAVAGVCHARGVNAGLPAQWLIYITVADLEHSLARCRELGGEVVREARGMGGMGRFAVVRDPAGAVCALFQKA